MNEDQLIVILQGRQAGKKWGYIHNESGVLHESIFQSFEALKGMLPTYTIELMPETITCNGVEISAPLRFAPEGGVQYFVADPGAIYFCHAEKWDGMELERRWLRRGLCHATEEAAAAHGRALCGAKA